ncbi:MAG: DUF2156 domain-containing protein [Oscillospiraceae bacterium]|nr:DUF2156 domain-containing protein [Oscillospiraceae bacterium]
MLEFKKIDISDKKWIDELLALSDFKGCEYSFANNMAWQRLSNSKITRYKDFYLIGAVDSDEPFFTYPAGKGDIFELVDVLDEFVGDKKLVMTSLTKENLEIFKQHYGDMITVEADEGHFDYIYNADDLKNMAGKKFHGKRNHIKRFKEKNDWEFKELSHDLFDDCISFAVNSYNENNDYDDYSAVCEQFAIHTFFENYETLGLKGGVLFANGQLAGFTIGEKINSDTFVVHIEKALSEIQGAYPTLCNEFAKTVDEDVKFINREEDLGIEGLRKSKRSYNPAFLLEKYTVIFDKQKG